MGVEGRLRPRERADVIAPQLAVKLFRGPMAIEGTRRSAGPELAAIFRTETGSAKRGSSINLLSRPGKGAQIGDRGSGTSIRQLVRRQHLPRPLRNAPIDRSGQGAFSDHAPPTHVAGRR